MSRWRSNRDLLDLVEAHVVAAPVVEPRRPWRLMRGDLLRHLQTAAIFEVGGNARRPKRVTANFGVDAGGPGPLADHPVDIGLPHRPGRERVGFAGRRAKQRPFGIGLQQSAPHVRLQIGVERVMGRHVVTLAALFVQPHPAG